MVISKSKVKGLLALDDASECIRLKKKIEELERVNELMIGRELKMVELKKKLKTKE